MKKQILIFVVAVALVALAAFGYIFTKDNSSSTSQTDSFDKPCTQEAMVCPDGSSVGRTGPTCEFQACPDSVTNSNNKTPPPPSSIKETTETTSTVPASKPGTYTTYSENQLKTANERGDKVVLFFHAPWCPFCKTADAAFLANLDKIPSGVTLLKTDYDTETELKKKYIVTYQHTFVQVDSSGNLVTKWNGGDIDNLIKYIK